MCRVIHLLVSPPPVVTMSGAGDERRVSVPACFMPRLGLGCWQVKKIFEAGFDHVCVAYFLRQNTCKDEVSVQSANMKILTGCYYYKFKKHAPNPFPSELKSNTQYFFFFPANYNDIIIFPANLYASELHRRGGSGCGVGRS